MDPHLTQFFLTPTIGGYPETLHIKSKQSIKKNESRLRKMMNEAVMKPDYPYRDSKLHTFQKAQEKMTKNSNSYSHQNLPRKRDTFLQCHETQNPELYLQRSDFNLAQKHPHDAIEAELEKLSRRKQLSGQYIDNSQSSMERNQNAIEGEMREDKLRNPQKYIIQSKEIRSTDQEIYRMKQNINFELQKFTRSKGIEYLKNINFMRSSSSIKRSKAEYKEPGKKRIIDTSKKKYLNYIPEVFTNLKPKKQLSTKLKTEEVQPKPPVYIDERMAKMTQLTNKQEMLGKLVLEKVRKHLSKEKMPGIKYYQRVKSEENIDDTLIELLKTKIDRAEVALK